jgi:hypothetical protein
VSDPSGNLSASFLSATPVVSAGAPLASHTFQGDSVEEASWGVVTYLGSKSGGDPHCENGGSCVKLGPYIDSPSYFYSPTATGIAGLLTAKPGASVAVRYRVTSPGPDSQVGYLSPPPFELVVATHDGMTVDSPSTVQLGDLVDQGPTAGDDRFATTWRTDVFPVTGDLSSGEVAFEVRAVPGVNSFGVPGPETTVMQIYIESVTTTP